MPAPTATVNRKEAGVVLSKRGKVTARNPAGDSRILKRGDPIYADDMVHTVRGANVQLKMDDRNIVMLRGGCSFRVSIYQSLDNSPATGQRFEYIGGVLRESRRESVPLLDLGIQ
ncbi:hypothetical protein [Thiothrix nivea]|uniref:Uncharacterized protein n=1 Tax=Thiothrix nivea (strain ATCC 35100 / DSM 5205 / JP2) TaxID=870187 RepID=A0A656HJU8_THINJ|nr:hypothetical protein [Thiothrix nivea]EIJ35786.1 hypothetical protein Thini_3269 [Thiothrix nivea DSM 5205]